MAADLSNTQNTRGRNKLRSLFSDKMSMKNYKSHKFIKFSFKNKKVMSSDEM
jgi:hypothetical protein